jgi:hypothetical protein
LELEAREAISYVITWARSDTPRLVSPLGIRFDALVAFAHDGIIRESCALLSQTWVV